MSVSIRITSSSGGDSLARFRWTSAAVEWADEQGRIGRAALKAASPVGRGPRAGRLRDSIRYERRTAAGGVTATFTAHTPYARWVVEGTAPHIIRATAARYLHWVDTSGHDHFAKQVNHPGTRPNPFPRRALAPLTPAMQRRLAEIVSNRLRG